MLLKILIAMVIVWVGFVMLGLAAGWINFAAKKWLSPNRYEAFTFWCGVLVIALVIIYALFFAGPMYSHRM